MKNIHLCSILVLTLSFFGFQSCSSDLTNQEPDIVTIDSFRSAATLPDNIDNPYDVVGRLHTEIVEAYISNQAEDTSLLEIINTIESIADINAAFSIIKGTTYQSVSGERISYILDHPGSSLASIISDSSLSVEAQVSLTGFVHSFIDLLENENDVVVFYETTVNFEEEVLGSSSFTETDKRILLTTTSIMRHSTHVAKRKPKKNTDPDWTIFIGNFTAAIEGAGFGSAEAIVMAVVAGIAQN